MSHVSFVDQFEHLLYLGYLFLKLIFKLQNEPLAWSSIICCE